ncbi:hypothetical protein ACFPRL_00680 [Pseudoclavibacter helvolus]
MRKKPATSLRGSRRRRSAIATATSPSSTSGQQTRYRPRKHHRPPSRSLVGRPDGVYVMCEWPRPIARRC